MMILTTSQPRPVLERRGTYLLLQGQKCSSALLGLSRVAARVQRSRWPAAQGRARF